MLVWNRVPYLQTNPCRHWLDAGLVQLSTWVFQLESFNDSWKVNIWGRWIVIFCLLRQIHVFVFNNWINHRVINNWRRYRASNFIGRREPQYNHHLLDAIPGFGDCFRVSLAMAKWPIISVFQTKMDPYESDNKNNNNKKGRRSSSSSSSSSSSRSSRRRSRRRRRSISSSSSSSSSRSSRSRRRRRSRSRRRRSRSSSCSSSRVIVAVLVGSNQPPACPSNQ